MMVIFFTVLLFVISQLFLSIFRLGLSNHSEAIILKLFNLVSSELTSLFRWCWIIAVFCLYLFSLLFFEFGFVLTLFTFPFSCIPVVSSVITFASEWPISVIFVISVPVITPFSLLFFFNWLLRWLLRGSLSCNFWNNRRSFLLDNNLRSFRGFLYHRFRFVLNYKGLWLWLYWNNLNFGWRLFNFNFLYFRLLIQNVIHYLFLVNFNMLYLIIAVFLDVSS